MKMCKWLLILFVGMTSLTGFSSTTDLTENSFAISVDVDVGITEAVLVERDFLDVPIVTSENFNSRMYIQSKAIYLDLDINDINKEKEVILSVPWKYSKENSKSYSIINFRCPRDSL